MAKELEEYLRVHIAQHGPLDIGQFMALALGHPQHGYYMKQDPFGADGDFTTAPEISQLFGEILGAWGADIWMQTGQPAAFTLLECGPGRGTLMADMLRATHQIPGFHEAVSIHLLETSPVLKEVQAERLADYEPHWHETLESVPGDAPLIVIGNEFLDALPVRQFVRTAEGWAERVVGQEDDSFVFGLKAAGPVELPEAPEGAVYEIAPARTAFVENLCKILEQNGGVALFIDYGHDRSASGDTVQALYKHEYVSPLEHIGDADLTAHVDFQAIGEAATHKGAEVFGPVEQGVFLKNLGIEQRAQYLRQKADDSQAEELQSGLHRLTHSDQMGALFKVMGVFYGDTIRPAGF